MMGSGIEPDGRTARCRRPEPPSGAERDAAGPLSRLGCSGSTSRRVRRGPAKRVAAAAPPVPGEAAAVPAPLAPATAARRAAEEPPALLAAGVEAGSLQRSDRPPG